MKTLRIYLWKEIAAATGFMLFALLSLFTFFDLVAQLDEIGQRGFLCGMRSLMSRSRCRHACTK